MTEERPEDRMDRIVSQLIQSGRWEWLCNKYSIEESSYHLVSEALNIKNSLDELHRTGCLTEPW